ncbi:M15 family metallopeptidase [Acaryochloris sp. CCMEE 5410]|uniref:M15 family metallopeptidase n=1 Tax=Acaryochloris sp. CCMEE 5410 TaxID=310037 RepID=UPI0002483E94|nr:M15 family metallopeptidase [Acaryochloris sp. CCMEE 5410]KAI9135371.1 D-alanyl-D-alanine carboxypeptidase family protein [Acaryochloris sp. CCMEE 5410]
MKGFQKIFGQFQFVVISLLTTAVIVWLAASLQLVPADSPVSQEQSPQPSAQSPGETSQPLPPATSRPPSPLYESLPSISNAPSPAKAPATPAASAPNNYYGHLSYAENEDNRLVNVGEFVRGTYRRSEYLDQEAAAAFTQLVNAAADANLTLQPISGFRSVNDQKELFDKQVQKLGSVEAATKLSAPPGFSEHHTGYAIDIGDRNQPEKDLKVAFEDTTAYEWLTNNARNYGFELSFPRNNAQGVNFEPWHWRYIGTSRAAVQFASARNL